VIGVGGTGEVRLVTGIAGGWRRCVVVVRVALCAGECSVQTGEWIIRVHSMIEIYVRPISGGVAGFACCRERGSGMVWICGSVPISLVTAKAISRQRRVVVVCVARGTWNRCVRSGERERGRVVVERRGRPCCRGVAQRAIGRKARRGVVWTSGASEVFLVASVTAGWQRCVVVVHVA